MKKISPHPARAPRAGGVGCVNCRLESSPSRIRRKAPLHFRGGFQRQVPSRRAVHRLAGVLFEGGSERELLLPSSLPSAPPRSSPASSGRAEATPFSFPNRPCNLRPCDRRADKKGIQLNGSAWLKVRQSYLFTASKTCGIVQGTDRVTTLSPGVLGLVAPERNCTAEGLERGSLARWARSNLRCLFKPSP